MYKISISEIVRFSAIISMFIVFWACEDEYKPFDDSPTVKITASKIRFLNLHFKQPSLNIKVGNRTFAEDVPYRQLTASQEAVAEVIGDTILTIEDLAGNVLLTQKLKMGGVGSNNTIVITPDYERVNSNFLFPDRLLLKAKVESARIAVLNDLTGPPLDDRTAIRRVTVAPDEAALGSANVQSLPIVPFIDSANYDALLGEQLYEGSFYILNATPFKLPVTQLDEAYDKNNLLFYQSTGYQIRSPQTTYFHIGLPDNGFGNGYPINSSTLPFNLEGGKSYTVLSSGTVGLVNDVARATVEKTPIPLEPIPYEFYFIEDSDLSARLIEPVTLYPDLEYYAYINLCGFNEGWINSYPNVGLNLLANGARAFNKPFESNSISRYVFNATGKQQIKLTPASATYPVLGTSEIELRRGGEYLALYYKDLAGQDQFHVMELQRQPIANVLRLNIAHFSPDLGEIDLIDAKTKEVLISNISYSAVTNIIDLPVERLEKGNDITETVPVLRVVKHGTSEELFEVNLSSSGRLMSGNARNRAYVGTLFLSGRYHTPELYPFSKQLTISQINRSPETTADEASDWLVELKEI
jgi:hypothetical protein